MTPRPFLCSVVLAATLNGAAPAGSPTFDLEPVDGAGTLFQWSLIPGALRYDVIRGGIGELFDDGSSVHLGSAVCVENDSTDATTAEGTEPASPDTLLPPPGGVFFYLVRSSDGVTDGTFGSATNGTERVVDLGGCLNEGEPSPGVLVVRPGRPGLDDLLGLRLAAADPDWSLQGTTMIGPLVLETTGVDGGTFSVRYAGGATLSDGSGPILDRAIPDDGVDPTTILLPDVRFPSQDEAPGTILEVEVRNPRGVAAWVMVGLNVDADPPTTPLGFSIDRSPYLGSGSERSGEADLGWTASMDDGGGGGLVTRYELRAMCQIRPGCGETDWAPVDVWESQTLIAELTGDLTALHLPSIGLDESWRIGLRAFDEVDNWSAVTEVGLSTRLTRATIGVHPGLAGSTTVGLVSLGDVNDDGLDDLAVSSYGSMTLMLGESDPTAPIIPGNPFTVPPPGDPTFFGSDLAAAGDVNGDGIDDFLVASFAFGAAGENRVHVYFGTGDLSELVQPDVTIQGPLDGTLTGAGFSRSGLGNFIDIGAGPAFDDLIVSVWDFLGGGSANLYVVLGRATADWPSSLTLVTGPTQAADNCANDIVTIPGVNGPLGLPLLEFGLISGMTTLNDDTWSDVIASTANAGDGQSSAQYVFRGAGLATCPTGYDLGAADEIVVNSGAGATYFRPSLAVLPAGREYAAGLPDLDLVEVYRFEPLSQRTVAYQTISSTAPAGGERFGVSLTYVGNSDQDATGGIDLAVGAPSTTTDPGRVYLALSGDTDSRLPSAAGLSLDLAGATAGFGTFVTGGFDYNGDGYPDLAVADLQNATIHLFY